MVCCGSEEAWPSGVANAVGLDDVFHLHELALLVGRCAGRAVRAIGVTSTVTSDMSLSIWPTVKQSCPCVYVCGGISSDPLQRLSDVERFDPRTGSWDSLPQMQGRRVSPVAGVIGNKLYVCGGGDADLGLGSAECLDLDVGTWEWLPSIPTPRAQAAGCTWRGQLFVCGGINLGWLVYSAYNVVESFNPTAGKWIQRPSMREGRISAAASVLGGMLFVVGGRTESTALSSVERLDPSRGEWEMVAPLPNPCSRPTATNYGGKLYVLGWEGADRVPLGTVLRLDPDIGWESVEPLSSGRTAASLIVADDRLFVFGGCTARGNLACDVEYLGADHKWSPAEVMLQRRCSAVARGVLG